MCVGLRLALLTTDRPRFAAAAASTWHDMWEIGLGGGRGGDGAGVCFMAFSGVEGVGRAGAFDKVEM